MASRVDPEYTEIRHQLSLLHQIVSEACPPRTGDEYAPSAAPSARNLAQYKALRSQDLRPLQHRLVDAGLSSLGRCEPWVLGSVETALRAATALCGEPIGNTVPRPDLAEPAWPPSTMAEGRALLDSRADELLGPRPPERSVRVMVTMPDEAAEGPEFVRGCLEAGMGIMRINTSAGDARRWRDMIRHLRTAELETGRSCRVFADLPGPKLRIASIIRGSKSLERPRLHTGDEFAIALGSKTDAGASAGHDRKHKIVAVEPARLLAHVEAGHTVWFDDGKLGAVIERRSNDMLFARVTFAKPGGQRLRAGKGLNLPDSDIETPALTPRDLEIMQELWGEADVFGLSFVRSPDDVRKMRLACAELRREQGGPEPGVVLKIETRRGFERLPELLFELLRCRCGGVMLARGDLAVECGFERMAEIQEEVLCFCEAAHVPVIWATEVLSTLARLGRPTRAEITDAAVAQRAECVMLNKGPRILDAVRSLCDILGRMQQHQVKKTQMFKPLSIASAGADISISAYSEPVTEPAEPGPSNRCPE